MSDIKCPICFSLSCLANKALEFIECLPIPRSDKLKHIGHFLLPPLSLGYKLAAAHLKGDPT